ncbi:hypothetical protein IHE45_05G073400 [Dioscorea alata]|uniref:Uncharacterized protein n=1 Tax=Dioscorea alata TaxID=55571 RepID=A0ACB7W276_DIOAL|nr:hypothetical protein IHE45_05G073400 [Dioscorea alata]
MDRIVNLPALFCDSKICTLRCLSIVCSHYQNQLH